VGRKVYIRLIVLDFLQLKVPDLKTYREAAPTLKAVGLEEGTITYVPNLGRNIVLEMRYKGRNSRAIKYLNHPNEGFSLRDGKMVMKKIKTVL
jgi:hypothetical protein